MNFQAADNIVGIDAVLTGRSTEHIVVGHSPVLKSDDGSRGGDCQSGDITARFRNIIKAEPAAHYLAAVIEGATVNTGASDLSRGSTFVGQRSNIPKLPFSLALHAAQGAGALADRDGMSHESLRKPDVEKVSAHRPRQILFA